MRINPLTSFYHPPYLPAKAIEAMILGTFVWAVLVIACEAAKEIWNSLIHPEPMEWPPDSEDE